MKNKFQPKSNNNNKKKKKGKRCEISTRNRDENSRLVITDKHSSACDS